MFNLSFGFFTWLSPTHTSKPHGDLVAIVPWHPARPPIRELLLHPITQGELLLHPVTNLRRTQLVELRPPQALTDLVSMIMFYYTREPTTIQ